jgi:1-acyl-sn-glycerol-3-phosphate acyltransferase
MNQEKHSQDKFDPAFARKARRVIGLYYDWYHRCGVHGIADVPDRPTLFVANHNGVLGSEVLMLLEGWFRHAPPRAPRVLGLAHDVIFSHNAFKWWVPRLGAIPATPENAREALAKGYSALVYPGGDRDIFRPWSKRDRVDFDGRKGYAEIAVEMNVPIVPIANVGGHESTIVLHRSDALAAMLDLKKKYRMRGVPITFRGLPFVPWLFWNRTQDMAVNAIIGLAGLPLPAKMDFYFERAIELDPSQKTKLSRQEQVNLLNRRTIEALEGRMRTEYRKPRIPVLGPVPFV